MSKLKIKLGLIQKAFQAEIVHNMEEVQKYFKNMEEIWKSWRELNKVDFISRFFEDLGPTIFLLWLSDVFPFNYDRLSARCPCSPSNEEALLEIIYEYDKWELEVIKDALISHWMQDSEDHVAQILFIEAIKSISDVFSKIIQHPFKIFTSNVDLVKENTSLKVHYFGAGRVVR
ncbi:MAG: hypothetical protein ACTSYB_17450 [Candidatus Helarchaeota archaeon]